MRSEAVFRAEFSQCNSEWQRREGRCPVWAHSFQLPPAEPVCSHQAGPALVVPAPQHLGECAAHVLGLRPAVRALWHWGWGDTEHQNGLPVDQVTVSADAQDCPGLFLSSEPLLSEHCPCLRPVRVAVEFCVCEVYVRECLLGSLAALRSALRAHREGEGEPPTIHINTHTQSCFGGTGQVGM